MIFTAHLLFGSVSCDRPCFLQQQADVNFEYLLRQKASQKPLYVINTILFPQVSLLRLLKDCIILPSSIVLENTNQGFH